MYWLLSVKIYANVLKLFLRLAVFLVVADESIGRSVPFVFLERVKDDFMKRYGASIKNEGAHPLADDDDDDDLFEDRFSIAYNLDREFGSVVARSFLNFRLLLFSFVFSVLNFFIWLCRPALKEHMQYCMNHPEEMSKLSKLKAQITEVKGIMMDNIEKVYNTKPNDMQTLLAASCYQMFLALDPRIYLWMCCSIVCAILLGSDLNFWEGEWWKDDTISIAMLFQTVNFNVAS